MNTLTIKSLVLSVSILVLFIPSFAAALSFSDVPKDFPHYNSIEFLKEKGIVEGYKSKASKNAFFKPNNEIVRAEALKMILEISEINVKEDKFVEKFNDVKKKQWFFPYVMKASELKIVKGYGDGKFKPGQNVTLAEALKMLFVASDIDVSNYKNKKPVFSDVASDDWFAGYVNYASEKMIITGMRDGRFKPHRKITRGQLAEIIYRMTSVHENNGKAYDLAKNWPEFEHPIENYKIKYEPSWKIQQYANLTAIWKGGESNNERFFAQQNSKSTYLAIYQDSNNDDLSKDSYFAKQITALKKGNKSSYKTLKGTLNEIPYLKISEPKISEKWYFFLPNKQVLIAYLNMKSEEVSFREKVEMNAMIQSIYFNPKKLSKDENPIDVLSKIRENILVEGKGKKMVDMLGDAKIIETDTIGVGTGPVDYYYSKKFDVTLKYERAADLLLDVQKTERTDF